MGPPLQLLPMCGALSVATSTSAAQSPYTEHWCTLLRPWENYVPVDEHLADLVHTVQWARAYAPRTRPVHVPCASRAAPLEPLDARRAHRPPCDGRPQTNDNEAAMTALADRTARPPHHHHQRVPNTSCLRPHSRRPCLGPSVYTSAAAC